MSTQGPSGEDLFDPMAIEEVLWVPEHPTWWQTGVIYQIYPRSFMDASGDGIGDLRGIRSRVSYLAWLGIDAVWLAPVYPSPMVDFGYDISDYTAVDTVFGDLTDFDALLGELHEAGIRLIMDFVPNHTSSEHTWFKNSRRDRTNPHRDWYVWANAVDDGPPNNWTSYFGGPAWTWDTHTGQYFLHSFDPAQPDLNWRNADVREAMKHALRFWLHRGVDGFRVDVLWLLGKDERLRDNPINPHWRDVEPSWRRHLRVHSEDTPESHAYARQLRSVVDEFRDRVMVAEVVLPPERAVSYHGRSNDEAHLPHNFLLTEVEQWTALELRSVIARYYGALPPGAWPNWLLGDHDFERIATRAGLHSVRVCMMLLLTLRGTPTSYYGDELGLPNGDIAPEFAADPQRRGFPGRDREGARTPMQWKAGLGGGFTKGKPWLPLATDDPQYTVEAQSQSPDSTLTLFHDLLRLRAAKRALSVGGFLWADGIVDPTRVLAYHRTHPSGAVLVALNFSDEAVPLSGTCHQAACYISTHTDARTAATMTLHELKPYEGVVFKDPGLVESPGA